MSDKTPGQINYENYTFDHLPNRHAEKLWSLNNQEIRDSWELAARAIRAPLLARIAELEAAVVAVQKCDCGRFLSHRTCSRCDRDGF